MGCCQWCHRVVLESGSVGFQSGWVGSGRVWSGSVGYLSGLIGYQSGLIAKHAIAKLREFSGARHFSEYQWLARLRVWAPTVRPEVVECCCRSVWALEEKAEDVWCTQKESIHIRVRGI